MQLNNTANLCSQINIKSQSIVPKPNLTLEWIAKTWLWNYLNWSPFKLPIIMAHHLPLFSVYSAGNNRSSYWQTSYALLEEEMDGLCSFSVDNKRSIKYSYLTVNFQHYHLSFLNAVDRNWYGQRKGDGMVPICWKRMSWHTNFKQVEWHPIPTEATTIYNSYLINFTHACY